jgi:hypothetical protein
VAFNKTKKEKGAIIMHGKGKMGKGKGKGKPAFGIMVAVTETPVGKAYKKAMKKGKKK